MNEKGVVSVTDYLPRPKQAEHPKPLLPWLIRRVECIRGTVPLSMQCAPAFNYARSEHTTSIIDDDSTNSSSTQPQQKVVFESKELTLDLRYILENTLVG